MHALPEAPLKVQEAMTIRQMIDELSKLPEGISVSVAISSPLNPASGTMDSYSGLIVINTPNGPVIFVAGSAFIPTTNVHSLVKVFSGDSSDHYLNHPVRLLRQEEGFSMNISNVSGSHQLAILGHSDVNGRINDSMFHKYGLVDIMNNGTFATLLFAKL